MDPARGKFRRRTRDAALLLAFAGLLAVIVGNFMPGKDAKPTKARASGHPATGSGPSGPAAGPPSAPGSATAPSTGAATTSTPISPAAPAGVYFDNFDYTGPADPALFKHGWLVRTGKGVPGIPDTWSARGVSFPADPQAQDGHVLQLEAQTDGTKAGTTQAEIQTASNKFFTGTFAARVFFSDAPTTGRDGDHVNESFYAISQNDSISNTRYSELDNEYMPNGGWGNKGPFLDTTSYYTPDWRKETTTRTHRSLQGWHTVIMTAVGGVANYYIDNTRVFSSSGKFFPREGMVVNFNTWFIDLPFAGPRTWDMKADWFYYQTGKALSAASVQSAVAKLNSSGLNFVDTVSPH